MIDEHRPSLCFLVMGPHRCGTSLVAGILHHLGVDMGPQAPLAASAPPSNPLGQFEDWDCIKFCGELAGNWRSPRYRDLYYSWELEAVQGLLELRCVESAVWGMKDPRLCICGEVFLGALEQSKIPTGIIFVQRDLEAATKSLMRRDKFPRLVCEHLLSRYWLNLERISCYANAKNIYAITIRYEDILEHPEEMITSFANNLALIPTPEQLAAAVAHVRPELNHANNP